MAELGTLHELLNGYSNIQRRSLIIDRGEFLIRQGEVESHIYYIHSGAIHAFYVSDHEEHTIRFGYKGSLITSIPSFYNGQPSELFLQAIRKTEITAYSRQSFFKAMETSEELQSFYLTSLEQLAAQQMERELDLLTSSPHERIQRVLKRSPQVFQEIPAKYIASYLRMTPETLSRILNS